MLNNVQLTFITPQSETEFKEYYQDFQFLQHFFPFRLTGDELKVFLESRIGHATLVYANHILIGAFMLDIYRNSVELHGIGRPDMNKVIPQHKRVKLYVFNLILQEAFDGLSKDKVVIKAEDTNQGVRGFALMFGFKKLKYKDKGRSVWVLDKQTYLNRKN